MPQSNRLYTAGQGSGSAQNRRVAINVQGSNNASLPALQSFTTTSETQFTDPAVANSIPLACVIPPGGPCEQESFELVFSGYVTPTQSATVIFKVYFGDSATISRVVLWISLRYPLIIPITCFSAGVLVGHLFLYQLVRN